MPTSEMDDTKYYKALQNICLKKKYDSPFKIEIKLYVI